MEMDRIQVDGVELSSVKRRFLRAVEDDPVQVEDFSLIHGDVAGTGCRNTVMSALVDMHLIAAIPNIDFACELGEFARMDSDPTDGVEIVDGALSVTHVPGHGASLRDPSLLR